MNNYIKSLVENAINEIDREFYSDVNFLDFDKSSAEDRINRIDNEMNMSYEDKLKYYKSEIGGRNKKYQNTYSRDLIFKAFLDMVKETQLVNKKETRKDDNGEIIKDKNGKPKKFTVRDENGKIVKVPKKSKDMQINRGLAKDFPLLGVLNDKFNKDVKYAMTLEERNKLVDTIVSYYKKALTDEPEVNFSGNSKMKKTNNASFLSSNEKMDKSGNGYYEFFNLGIPAYKGVVYDGKKNTFVEVSTCPSAGTCTLFCYAMSGRYILVGTALKMSLTLTTMLNNPRKFFNNLKNELRKKAKIINSKNGTAVFRVNDAGDFFSKKYAEECVKIVEDLAKEGYDLKGYAYTKDPEIASIYNESDDFIMNLSTDLQNTGNQVKGSVFKKFNDNKPDEIKKLKLSTVMNAGKVLMDKFPEKWSEGNGLIKKDTQLSNAEIQELKKYVSKNTSFSIDNVVMYDEFESRELYNDTKNNYAVIVHPKNGDKAALFKNVRLSILLEH